MADTNNDINADESWQSYWHLRAGPALRAAPGVRQVRDFFDVGVTTGWRFWGVTALVIPLLLISVYWYGKRVERAELAGRAKHMAEKIVAERRAQLAAEREELAALRLQLERARIEHEREDSAAASAAESLGGETVLSRDDAKRLRGR